MRAKRLNRVIGAGQFGFAECCMHFLVADLMQQDRRSALASFEFWDQMVQAAAPVRDWAVAERADRIIFGHHRKVALMGAQRKRAKMAQAVVIGAGPAGLMAAEQLSSVGHDVLVAEAKPSVARKFLMAGKSGLNLTKDEPFEEFVTAYAEASDWLRPILAEFDAQGVQNWAKGLGQDVFTGSTGRVFPTSMKASPLLRAWLGQLESAGVRIRTRWRWTGWDGASLTFDTPDGVQRMTPTVTVLALGGASWSRLGSDGKWASTLAERDIELSPFAPSNAALSIDWSAYMQPHFGAALKSVRWVAADQQSRGEATISAHGLEGGGLYPLTPALRQGADLHVDLLPDLSSQDLQKRWAAKRPKASMTQWLKNGLRLSPQKVALFHEMSKAQNASTRDALDMIKALPIPYAGLRPLDEAISTAGGVSRVALTDALMLRAMPGVFCAGEMLDWEAPTGGYLITACLATGRWAGRSAANWLARGG